MGILPTFPRVSRRCEMNSSHCTAWVRECCSTRKYRGNRNNFSGIIASIERSTFRRCKSNVLICCCLLKAEETDICCQICCKFSPNLSDAFRPVPECRRGPPRDCYPKTSSEVMSKFWENAPPPVTKRLGSFDRSSMYTYFILNKSLYTALLAALWFIADHYMV